MRQAQGLKDSQNGLVPIYGSQHKVPTLLRSQGPPEPACAKQAEKDALRPHVTDTSEFERRGWRNDVESQHTNTHIYIYIQTYIYIQSVPEL